MLKPEHSPPGNASPEELAERYGVTRAGLARLARLNPDRLTGEPVTAEARRALNHLNRL